MKKRPEHLSPSIALSNSVNFPVKHPNKKKEFKIPDPPSEETVMRLNAIVKEAPFCYHYKGRKNDFL
jgi:hypothetical protein